MIVTKADEFGDVQVHQLTDLIEVQETSDHVTFVHGQHTGRIQEQVQIIKADTDRGFTKQRTMQWVARIPALIYAQHPEFMQDPSSIDRFLMTEEGSRYRIADGVATPKRRGKLIMSVNPEGKVTTY